MNAEAVTLLLEANRYNIEILPQLESYVQQQVDKQSYHFEANQAVLKFYQFYPEKVQKFIIAKILIKALMNLPSTDFLLHTYLIPEPLHSEEPIKILLALANQLETCKFKAFWEEAKSCRELLEKIPGFDDAIRNYITGVLLQTYLTISKEALSVALNLSGSALDSVVTARGWTQSSDAVTFPKPEDATLAAKGKKKSDIAKVDDLGRILSALNEV